MLKTQYQIDVWNATMDFIKKIKNPPSTKIVRTQSESKDSCETNGYVLKFHCKICLLLWSAMDRFKKKKSEKRRWKSECR